MRLRLVLIAAVALVISAPMAQAQFGFSSATVEGSNLYNAPNYGCKTTPSGTIACSDYSTAPAAGTIWAAAWGYGSSCKMNPTLVADTVNFPACQQNKGTYFYVTAYESGGAPNGYTISSGAIMNMPYDYYTDDQNGNCLTGWVDYEEGANGGGPC